MHARFVYVITHHYHRPTSATHYLPIFVIDFKAGERVVVYFLWMLHTTHNKQQQQKHTAVYKIIIVVSQSSRSSNKVFSPRNDDLQLRKCDGL